MKLFDLRISCLIYLLLSGCAESNHTNKPVDAFEAGRYFIDASLKGNYREAKKYLLADSLNIMYLDRMSDFYNKMKSEEKEGYKNSNIIISNDGIQNVSDSVIIINYSNSFKNKPSKIKVTKVNGEWLVDFKYTFSGNM